MIKLTELGVTFLGGGELNIGDLVYATKLAPKLIAADGAADVAIKNGFVPTAVIGDMDSISNGFIYMVSSASTTGAQSGFGQKQQDYFKRVADLKLKSPQIVGFGISNNETFRQATTHAKGAIIGSAFIKFLANKGVSKIPDFIAKITA